MHDDYNNLLTGTLAGSVVDRLSLFGVFTIIAFIGIFYVCLRWDCKNRSSWVPVGLLCLIPFSLQSLGVLKTLAKLWLEAKQGVVFAFDERFEEALSLMVGGLLFSVILMATVISKIAAHLFLRKFLAHR